MSVAPDALNEGSDTIAPGVEPQGGAAPEEDLPLTVIEPRKGWQVMGLRELWRFRELLGFLVWRDIKVRYKQTVLGAAWSVVQPLATMATFAFFLGRMGGVAADMADYPLFVFAGIVPWTFFANAVNSAGNSVVGNQVLVQKIYFPRLLIPIGTVGACLFDFLIALATLAVMIACYGVVPGWTLVLVPALVLLLMATALGVGSLMAALIVAQRDFRYVLAFGLQMWMFATPCIYLPLTTIGPYGQLLAPLNPAYGLLLNFRQAVLGRPPDWYALGVSSAVGLALLAAGCFYFRRMERTFPDVI
jgi:lipopolysaccharide transport system permease protein